METSLRYASPGVLAEIRKENSIWDRSCRPSDVHRSASTGCDICSRLSTKMRGILDFQIDQVSCCLEIEPISLLPKRLRFLLSSVVDAKWVSFEMFESILGEGMKSSSFSFTYLAGFILTCTSTGSIHRLRIPIGNSTSALACLELLSSSLRRCVAQHEECNQRLAQPWIPTRLVDVSSIADKDGIRLRGREDILAEIPGNRIYYTTLSHVWGKHRFFTLNNSNKQLLESGFSMHSLPKSFQDAIFLTRYLGLRYLWIDSLWLVLSC